jgi:hypothetical protein
MCTRVMQITEVICIFVPKVITASIPCGKGVLCPVVGEAIVLGLDLLALAMCLRGRGMIQVRV